MAGVGRRTSSRQTTGRRLRTRLPQHHAAPNQQQPGPQRRAHRRLRARSANRCGSVCVGARVRGRSANSVCGARKSQTSPRVPAACWGFCPYIENCTLSLAGSFLLKHDVGQSAPAGVGSAEVSTPIRVSVFTTRFLHRPSAHRHATCSTCHAPTSTMIALHSLATARLTCPAHRHGQHHHGSAVLTFPFPSSHTGCHLQSPTHIQHSVHRVQGQSAVQSSPDPQSLQIQNESSVSSPDPQSLQKLRRPSPSSSGQFETLPHSKSRLTHRASCIVQTKGKTALTD